MITHWINGQAQKSADGKTFATINPWTKEPWEEVSEAGQAEVDEAVAAARTAFDEGPWSHMGFAERGAILHKLADLIIENIDELADADTNDMGKPLSAMKVKDVPRAAQNFRFFGDHARLSTADNYPTDSGHHAYSRFEAAGVVAAIAPWNFPLMLESWKVAPALAWGSMVVLKPAEDSPASASILARLATEAGFPDGVFNVIHGFGPNAAGEMLTRHPDIDRITFTGESNTGRHIAAAGAEQLVPVSLELGGKGANIVFEDADLDGAISWSNKAIFTNAGQVCLAGSRLFVHSSIFDEFVDRFVESAKELVVGDPRDPATQIASLASEEHFSKVAGFFDHLPEEATVLCGGVDPGGGWVVHPTVIVGAPLDSSICRDEVFGPVATITSFDTEEEAVRLANDTKYGLNAMIFTENLRRAHRVSAALQAGTVWVNCFFVRDLRAPFGGVGWSGIGREGGLFSREFFTEPKAVVMDI